MSTIDHWMMFGTFGQQRYFVYPTPQTYKGVVINANMAAYAPAGLAGFLVEKTAGLEYVIDPLTHAFQHDPTALQDSEGNLKASFQTLATEYGAPFVERAGKRPLMPGDFAKEGVLKGVVEQCIGFQQRRLTDAMKATDSMKYLDEPAQEPYALVAPYFFVTEATLERWLPLSVQAAELALDCAPDKRVFSAVVVSQGVATNGEARNRLVDAYRQVGVHGFLLWIDDLDEQYAGKDELTGLLELSQGLRRNKEREVINLHGGYFSILASGRLGDSALSGVTHGPEFGESRSIVPVGGGIPIARYYLPRLHARVRYRDVLRLLNAKGWLDDATTFYRNVCECAECRDVLKENAGSFTEFGHGNVRPVRRGGMIVRMEYPTEETKKHCLRHYLQRKAIEYRFAATAHPDQIREDLRRGVLELEEVAGLDQVAHLELWHSVLTKRPLRD